MLKGDVSVYEEYRIGPGPPGPAGPAGAPGYFALFIALALGRLHVCVCARVLSFPRTSRGCVRRIHAPERIPHTGYAQEQGGDYPRQQATTYHTSSGVPGKKLR